jgi:hypothetical protein
MDYLRCSTRRTVRSSQDSMWLYSEVASTVQRSNALEEAICRGRRYDFE